MCKIWSMRLIALFIVPRLLDVIRSLSGVLTMAQPHSIVDN
jgi:hypothetical protein